MPDAAPRPNMIVILVDDMGYSDIGCYGSEIRTPHLDRLAGEGMRFTQMYNCARCCPTRASLLTGLYPHQAGVGHMVHDHGVGPAYQGYLRDDCMTIGEALKTAGYRTYYSGKWHVAKTYTPGAEEQHLMGTEGHPTPATRGFDRFWGTLAGAGSFFAPHSLVDQDRFVKPEGDDFYYTDAIADHACEFIGDAAGTGDPFFLHVCFTAPHWPLHAMAEDIARYESRYRDGWDVLRTARHEELKGLGVLNPRWEISPRDEQSRDFRELDAKRRDWEALRMAVYAAQVDRMDQGVGKILAKLDELGMADDTMVMFLSDNGGCAEFLAEDGHVQRYNQVPTKCGPMRVGNLPELAPGPANTFMSYDLPWANASNSPFRLYKHWVHEGGVSTPLIVRLPGRTGEGAFHHAPAHVIDIMATCLDLAGVTLPGESGGKRVQPLEGESLLPAFRDADWRRDRPIFFEHEGNRAVRLADWKLVSKYPGRWELYELNDDRTELNDLSEQSPERVAAMVDLYDDWAQRAGVVDWATLR